MSRRRSSDFWKCISDHVSESSTSRCAFVILQCFALNHPIFLTVLVFLRIVLILLTCSSDSTTWATRVASRNARRRNLINRVSIQTKKKQVARTQRLLSCGTIPPATCASLPLLDVQMKNHPLLKRTASVERKCGQLCAHFADLASLLRGLISIYARGFLIMFVIL